MENSKQCPQVTLSERKQAEEASLFFESSRGGSEERDGAVGATRTSSRQKRGKKECRWADWSPGFVKSRGRRVRIFRSAPFCQKGRSREKRSTLVVKATSISRKRRECNLSEKSAGRKENSYSHWLT